MSASEQDGFRAQQEAVDDLEQEALQATTTEPVDPDDAEHDDESPAFELDLDPEDQGSADAGAANPD